MRGPAGRESLCADYPLRRGQAHRADTGLIRRTAASAGVSLAARRRTTLSITLAILLVLAS